MRKASKRGWGRGWGADDTSGCRRHISLTCPDSLLLCLHKDRVALRKGVAHAAESFNADVDKDDESPSFEVEKI